MAGETAITTTEAPPAEAELAEVSLPTGMSMDEFTQFLSDPEVEDAEADKSEDQKPEPASEPVAAAPATPAQPTAAEPAKPKGDLRKALKEERGKRREAEARANRWEQLVKEKQQGLEKMQGRPQLQAVEVNKPRVDMIGRQAEEAEAAGKGVRPAVEAALNESHAVTQDATRKVLDAVMRYEMLKQEQELREELAEQGINYDYVMEQSGVFAGCRQIDAQGNFADPHMARYVFSSVNPFKRGFRLACDKLTAEGKPLKPGAPKAQAEPDDDDPAPTPTTPTPAAVAPAAPAPTADPVAEAKRAGAREVVEAVASHTKRPQGVRILRDAGQPVRVGKNLALWNSLKARMDMAERNPMSQEATKFLELLDSNPSLNQFLMAGPPKA